MHTAHLKSLQNKHQRLEKAIHSEQTHAARNTILIDRLKKEKLFIKQEIERAQQAG